MNITVYLGAYEGNDPKFKRAVTDFGSWIGNQRHTLIYGGSKSGLMGLLATSALAAGGKVIGVEPRFFIDAELQLDTLTQLIVTETMAERKAKMIELGDAYLAMPGGTGTLEEIAEVISLAKLGLHDKPCIFYDIDGFYDPIRDMLRVMVDKGFLKEEDLARIHFITSPEELEGILG